MKCVSPIGDFITPMYIHYLVCMTVEIDMHVRQCLLCPNHLYSVFEQSIDVSYVINIGQSV